MECSTAREKGAGTFRPRSIGSHGRSSKPPSVHALQTVERAAGDARFRTYMLPPDPAARQPRMTRGAGNRQFETVETEVKKLDAQPSERRAVMEQLNNKTVREDSLTTTTAAVNGIMIDEFAYGEIDNQ